MDEHLKSRARRVLCFALPSLLLFVAVCSWLGYLGQGLAYGDLFGVPGREKYLAEIGNRAKQFLEIALVLEALAVAMFAWLLSDTKPAWRRLCFSVVLASVADFFTYVFVRAF